MEDLCMDIDPPPFKENSLATAEDWRKALGKVVPAVVVLRTTACRAFDTESAGVSSATGFVVDKRRGIILTNRHVVKPGPVMAEAMFVNREEIPVYPIYRDPVHDFGFFRYDPGAIQFLSYEEIPLAPDAAAVGVEIRVVGNDSGEKVSILAGTLARLDRDAPQYKKDGYNDFNTFYMQAASGTKGGSSGSPVIDWQGRAVALNAGSKLSSASAFFLPLERVVRSLKFLQEGGYFSTNTRAAVSIPRGTLQVTFLHKGFDETRRLGLQHETEQLVRNSTPPSETGMLVVDSVVPGGPAQNHLEPGDVLVRMNGEVVTQFLKMETLLDDSVEQKIELQIERGSTPLTVDLLVQDLHSITPDHFLEVSGAVIHPLSYQQARNFRFNCGLVYVAEPGYMLFRAGVPRHSIIKKFAGEGISRLEDLITVLSKLSRGARVPLEYISYKERHQRKSVLVTIDRHEWYAPPQIYKRDDSSGLWTVKLAMRQESPHLVSGIYPVEQDLSNHTGSCTGEVSPKDYIPEQVSQEPRDAVTSMETSGEHVAEGPNSQDDSDNGTKKQRVEENSSVDGDVIADCSLNEHGEERLDESGSVEDAVLRDYQGAAPVAATSVAERVIEPTLVMFEVHVPSSCMLDGVHSQHFLGTGVIVYHSETMGLVAVDKNTVAVPVSDVMISFAAFPIEIPAEVVFLHPFHNFALVAYDPSALGAAGASVIRAAELLPDFGSTFSGVLTDERGRVQALWGSFSTQLKYSSSSSEEHQFVRGIPINTISQIVDRMTSGTGGPPRLINGLQRPMPCIRILEVELYPTLLSKARSFGLSDAWIQALVKKDPKRRQVLQVKGCFAGSKAENLLEQGDMVLAINKQPVTCFRDIEDACQSLDHSSHDDGRLDLTIFRQGNEIELLVGTDVRDGNGAKQAINWCGGILQDPYPAVRALGFLPEEGHGVYVARWCQGSPAHRHGLFALQWIVEVNGKPTPNLDAFVDVTKAIEHGEFVRVRTVHLNGKPRVLTLKQDLHYWPTWELRFDPETAMWRRKVIKALDSGVL
ncbi:protease Do-like 7 isoform X3 [Nicotiana tomentosiformis]|uniref:protease Do-like 7 isoform X3 n=1 Tax=Nicotiana tomentosiformis TaxID=4098 RepID=UPI00388C8120